MELRGGSVALSNFQLHSWIVRDIVLQVSRSARAKAMYFTQYVVARKATVVDRTLGAKGRSL